MTCAAGTRRNAERCRSCFAIRRTDLSVADVELGCWSEQALVSPSRCEQISFSTAALFASERADFGPPQTAIRSVADPVRSTRWQIF